MKETMEWDGIVYVAVSMPLVLITCIFTITASKAIIL